MSDHQEARIFSALRAAFGRGLVVIVPVVITVWVLNLLFNAIDGIMRPLFDQLLGWHIPGLGFISMIILILVVGAVSRNLIARSMFKLFERVVSSIPFARTIYTALKDLVSAIQPGQKGRSFSEVVLVEYPRAGMFTVGFVTNKIRFSGLNVPEEMISVYIPNPPNPTSGVLVLLPRQDATRLDMSVEDGLKLVLSGGIVTSGTITRK
jgi:uncharacterized membrane protein